MRPVAWYQRQDPGAEGQPRLLEGEARVCPGQGRSMGVPAADECGHAVLHPAVCIDPDRTTTECLVPVVRFVVGGGDPVGEHRHRVHHAHPGAVADHEGPQPDQAPPDGQHPRLQRQGPQWPASRQEGERRGQ